MPLFLLAPEEERGNKKRLRAQDEKNISQVHSERLTTLARIRAVAIDSKSSKALFHCRPVPQLLMAALKVKILG